MCEIAFVDDFASIGKRAQSVEGDKILFPFVKELFTILHSERIPPVSYIDTYLVCLDA